MNVSSFFKKIMCHGQSRVDDVDNRQKKCFKNINQVSSSHLSFVNSASVNRNPLVSTELVYNAIKKELRLEGCNVTLQNGQSYVISDPIVENYPDTLLAITNQNGKSVANIVIHGALYKNGYIRFLVKDKEYWGAKELAEFIKENSLLRHTQQVNLITCLGGKESAGGYTLGKQLADILGKPVQTFTEKVSVSGVVSKLSERAISESFVTNEKIGVKDRDKKYSIIYLPEKIS